MTLAGYATPQGTTSYRQRFADTLASAHFRETPDHLWCSSIGLGTYLGEADTQTGVMCSTPPSITVTNEVNV
jgi:hypothetical protein